MADPITKDQIERFVDAWFDALDRHAPVQECYKMLAGDSLEMHFPDTVICNLATFKEWYDSVTSQFFDEHHEVKCVHPQISGKQAKVDVVVRWQASWWEPATDKSQRADLVAAQKWIARRSSKNDFGLEIVYYDAEAEPFEFAPESARPPSRDTRIREPQETSLQAAYEQLCASYHKIDDFRAKLLGLLPLATGTGIFLLMNISKDQTPEFLGPIGAFGFVVTLGLFAYEIYGIRKCGALIAAGKQMEGQLDIDGQFISRPRGVLRYINEPFAAGIIYPAVLAAWMFLAALGFALAQIGWVIAISAFLVGFAGMFFYNWWLEGD